MDNQERILRLARDRSLEREDWEALFTEFTPEDRELARSLAQKQALESFGRKIFFRGIVEYTNICKNDCLYCGIRRSNKNVCRYRLTVEEILECCREGYGLGYRTFVIQGGEDDYWNDLRLCDLVERIHGEFPDCAITLSVGERSRESYEKLFAAGATRFLLRHETADEAHFGRLHPAFQTLENRMRCLRDLRDIGFQTGCGMMIGAPYQTPRTLAEDMVFMEEFQPQMVGIGPFIPHRDTPFRDFPAGSTEVTLFALSLVRLMLPRVLLPSTTALGSVEADGRKLGVLAGCNVVMPNLSPLSQRQKYMLYNNKAGMQDDARSSLETLRRQMCEIGYELVVDRGDFKRKEEAND